MAAHAAGEEGDELADLGRRHHAPERQDRLELVLATAARQFYYAHIGLMIDLIIKALSEALPDRVVAGQTASAENVIFSGKRPDGGTWVVGSRPPSAGVRTPRAMAPARW
jgi:hypothetical protein